MSNPRDSQQGNGIYEIFMLVLCIVALAGMAVGTFVALDEQTRQILSWMDWLICAVFLVDFTITLWRAPNRLKYLVTWGWIDFLSSIPAVDILRWGRLTRIFRIFRVLRGLRATRILSTFVVRRRASSAVAATSLITVLIVAFAGIAILQFETEPESNIKGAGDAIWWAVTTLTTVGYGDRFPVTAWGRILGALLMITGVGLFGTLSGFVASWMISPVQKSEQTDIDLLRNEIAELKKAIQESGASGNRIQRVESPESVVHDDPRKE